MIEECILLCISSADSNMWFPEREMAMSIWDSETLILRLIAVLFVFALLRFYRKGNATGRETVLYTIIVAASATVNLLRTGGGGLFLTAVGIAAALAVAVPLIVRSSLSSGSRVSARDVAAVAAVGAILGPLGGLAAMAVAAAIYAAHRLPGRQPALTDWLAPRFAMRSGRAFLPGKSILALIENRRLRGHLGGPDEGGPDECGPGECGPEDGDSISGSGSSPGRSPRVESLPWKTSLAVAMLAMLLTGVFI